MALISNSSQQNYVLTPTTMVPSSASSAGSAGSSSSSSSSGMTSSASSAMPTATSNVATKTTLTYTANAPTTSNAGYSASGSANSISNMLWVSTSSASSASYSGSAGSAGSGSYLSMISAGSAGSASYSSSASSTSSAGSASYTTTGIPASSAGSANFSYQTKAMIAGSPTNDLVGNQKPEIVSNIGEIKLTPEEYAKKDLETLETIIKSYLTGNTMTSNTLERDLGNLNSTLFLFEVKESVDGNRTDIGFTLKLPTGENRRFEITKYNNTSQKPLTKTDLLNSKVYDQNVINEFFEPCTDGFKETYYVFKDGYDWVKLEHEVANRCNDASILKNYMNGLLNVNSNFSYFMEPADVSHQTALSYVKDYGYLSNNQLEQLKSDCIDRLYKDFAEGKLSLDEAEDILTDVGVENLKITNTDVSSTISIKFSYNNKNYTIICNDKKAANSGSDNHKIQVYEYDVLKQYFTSTNINALFKRVAQGGSTPLYVLKDTASYDNLVKLFGADKAREVAKAIGFPRIETADPFAKIASLSATEYLNQIISNYTIDPTAFAEENSGQIRVPKNMLLKTVVKGSILESSNNSSSTELPGGIGRDSQFDNQETNNNKKANSDQKVDNDKETKNPPKTSNTSGSGAINSETEEYAFNQNEITEIVFDTEAYEEIFIGFLENSFEKLITAQTKQCSENNFLYGIINRDAIYEKVMDSISNYKYGTFFDIETLTFDLTKLNKIMAEEFNKAVKELAQEAQKPNIQKTSGDDIQSICMNQAYNYMEIIREYGDKIIVNDDGSKIRTSSLAMVYYQQSLNPTPEFIVSQIAYAETQKNLHIGELNSKTVSSVDADGFLTDENGNRIIIKLDEAVCIGQKNTNYIEQQLVSAQLNPFIRGNHFFAGTTNQYSSHFNLDSLSGGGKTSTEKTEEETDKKLNKGLKEQASKNINTRAAKQKEAAEACLCGLTEVSNIMGQLIKGEVLDIDNLEAIAVKYTSKGGTALAIVGGLILNLCDIYKEGFNMSTGYDLVVNILITMASLHPATKAFMSIPGVTTIITEIASNNKETIINCINNGIDVMVYIGEKVMEGLSKAWDAVSNWCSELWNDVTGLKEGYATANALYNSNPQINNASIANIGY